MEVICKYARLCSFAECNHRKIHETDNDGCFCMTILCEIDTRPNIDDIFCIPVIKIKR